MYCFLLGTEQEQSDWILNTAPQLFRHGKVFCRYQALIVGSDVVWEKENIKADC